MKKRTRVGVLGATGTVGERLVRLLADHPWFELAEVGASTRSAGALLRDSLPPSDLGPLNPEAGGLRLKNLDEPWSSPILLSALPGAVARDAEARLAERGHLVVSNASAYRMERDVPLVIPEVNPDHLELLETQRDRWPGAILTNPNCVVAGVALALAPIHRALGVERVMVTTFQAISGAGRPGPSAGEMTDNVIPFIQGEEEKLGQECRRILGTLRDGEIVEASITFSATTARVPVLHGHLAAVHVGFRGGGTPAQVREAMDRFGREAGGSELPLSPPRALEVVEGEARPQPRVDRDRGGGMTVSVGRIRECAVLDVTFVVLAHNLVRGAAGAALLNAELCRAEGRADRFGPATVAEELASG